MIRRILMILGALLATGCAKTTTAPSVSTTQSIESRSPSVVGRWNVVNIDGIAIESGKAILVFEADGAYRRQISCNQGIGAYSVVGGVLTLSAVGDTEKGCDPYENEALIDEAVRVGPWKVSAQGKDALLLEGRHRLQLQRRR